MVLHGLDLDRADAGGIGQRRAGHAGEDHRADDVHLRQTALHPADQRDGEAVDAAGDAGDVHQVAGQDEERHGQQREAFHPGDHALRQDHVGRHVVDQQVEQRRHGHGDGDGDADDHQDEEGDDQQGHGVILRPA